MCEGTSSDILVSNMSLADASDIADYYAKGMCVVCRGSRKEFSKVNFWNALLIKAARYTQKYT